MERVLSVSILAAILCLPGSARAGDQDWVGKRVVLKMGVEPTDAKSKYAPYLVYVVKRVENGKLRLAEEVGSELKKSVAPSDVVATEKAVDYYTHVIQSEPANARAYWRRANHRRVSDAHSFSMDFSISIDKTFQIKPSDPLNDPNPRPVGDGVDATRREVVADLSEAIRIKPDFAQAYMERGAAHIESRDYDHALADFNRAIEIDPSLPGGYSTRGFLCMTLKRNDQAMTDLTEAIRVDPTDAQAYAARAMLWAANNQQDKALADCDEAIRLDSNDVLTIWLRGVIRADRKEYEKAVKDLTELIRLAPGVPSPYSLRGAVRFRAKQYAKSLADNNRAMELGESDPSIHLLFAWVLATCPDAAFRDGKRALELAKNACAITGSMNPGHLDTLAAAYAEAGEFDSAVLWQTRALEQLTELDKKAEYQARLKLYQERKPYRQK